MDPNQGVAPPAYAAQHDQQQYIMQPQDQMQMQMQQGYQPGYDQNGYLLDPQQQFMQQQVQMEQMGYDSQAGYVDQAYHPEQIQYVDGGGGQMVPQQMQYIDDEVYADQRQISYTDEQQNARVISAAGAEAVGEQGIVTEQPTKADRKGKRKGKKKHHQGVAEGVEIDHDLAHSWADSREYFDSLDIPTVLLWDYREVAERFLRPLGLAPLAQIFIEHKINGRTLLGLDRTDLKQMQIKAVGDRVLINHAIKYLKKMQVRHDRDRIIWEGYTPYGSVQYFRDLKECIAFKCCPCLVSTTKYKITPVGIRVRTDPPTCNLRCKGVDHDNQDIRFMKDVDWVQTTCYWCCHRREISMQFENNDEVEYAVEEPILIAHPDVGDKMVNDIQNIWADARLVPQ